MKGTILLSDAVKKILLDTKRPHSDYFRFLSMAAEAVTTARLYVTSFPKQVVVELNDKEYIDFPDDFIQFVSVGVAHYGKLFTYTLEKDIITVLDEEGDPVESVNPPSPANAVAVKGGGNSHHFKISYEERRIYIMGYPPQDVYLTYVSSGISTTTPTYIPLEMVPFIRAAVMWEDKKYDENVHPSYKHQLETYFHQERSKLKSLREPSISEWSDAVRKTYTRRFRR